MSLSRLLLVAANSQKCIFGEGNDRIEIKPKASVSGNDPYAGEVVLCFQLDDKEKRVASSLGMQEADKRCDGLIFYARDKEEDRVICLVEMKSTNIKAAAEQIISTREHIMELLKQECDKHCSKQLSHIRWLACFYHHGVSPKEVASVYKQLGREQFKDIKDFNPTNYNAGPFLRGDSTNIQDTKDLATKVRRKNR